MEKNSYASASRRIRNARLRLLFNESGCQQLICRLLEAAIAILSSRTHLVEFLVEDGELVSVLVVFAADKGGVLAVEVVVRFLYPLADELAKPSR